MVLAQLEEWNNKIYSLLKKLFVFVYSKWHKKACITHKQLIKPIETVFLLVFVLQLSKVKKDT